MTNARLVRALLLASTVPFLLGMECPLLAEFCADNPGFPGCTIEADGKLGTSAPGTLENTGQDAFEFTVVEGATITITITHDGNLDVEAALFEPGVPTSGTALVEDGSVPSGGTLGGGPIGPLSGGTYTVALEDDRGDGSEEAGNYTITITSDIPLPSGLTQSIDEGPEEFRIDPNP